MDRPRSLAPLALGAALLPACLTKTYEIDESFAESHAAFAVTKIAPVEGPQGVALRPSAGEVLWLARGGWTESSLAAAALDGDRTPRTVAEYSLASTTDDGLDRLVLDGTDAYWSVPADDGATRRILSVSLTSPAEAAEVATGVIGGAFDAAGGELYYATSPAGADDSGLRRLAGTTPTSLPLTRDGSPFVAVAAHGLRLRGASLYFWTSSALYRVAAGGGAITTVATVDVSDLAFASDAVLFGILGYGGAATSIDRVEVATGEPESIAGDGWELFALPRVSPDGDALAFVVQASDCGSEQIRVVPLDADRRPVGAPVLAVLGHCVTDLALLGPAELVFTASGPEPGVYHARAR